MGFQKGDILNKFLSHILSKAYAIIKFVRVN